MLLDVNSMAYCAFGSHGELAFGMMLTGLAGVAFSVIRNSVSSDDCDGLVSSREIDTLTSTVASLPVGIMSRG